MADAETQERRVLELKMQLGKLDANAVRPTLDVLKQLDSIEITFVKVLARTDIGRVVGNLRKHENQEVSAVARDLVTKWKKLVPATSASPSLSRSGSGVASPRPASVAPASSTPAATTPAPMAIEPGASQDSLSIDASASQESLTAASSAAAARQPVHGPIGSKLDPAVLKQLKDGLAKAALGALRTKLAELLGEALLVNWNEDELAMTTVVTLASAIEAPVGLGARMPSEAFALANRDSAAAAYKDKVRMLVSNLRHPDNAELRWRVLRGELSAEALCSMTRIELAPALKRQEIEEHKKKNTVDAMEPKAIESTTDAFQCGRCKNRKCTYYQKQTRSADEPMTTFVTCTVCGNRWKFS